MTALPTASRYLDARVTTASQPELQLMLLDGALRFGRQAEQLWNVPEQGGEVERLLGRALDVVEALVQGVAAGRESEISKRLEEEYAFAFKQLALAQLNRDVAALNSALRLLSMERETWKLAVEKLRQGGDGAPTAGHDPTTAAPRPASPVLSSLGGFTGTAATSLSLEG